MGVRHIQLCSGFTCLLHRVHSWFSGDHMWCQNETWVSANGARALPALLSLESLRYFFWIPQGHASWSWPKWYFDFLSGQLILSSINELKNEISWSDKLQRAKCLLTLSQQYHKSNRFLINFEKLNHFSSFIVSYVMI